MRLTFILLALSICCVWIPDIRLRNTPAIRLWILVFLAAVISGLATYVLSPSALVPLSLLAALAWGSLRYRGHKARAFLTMAAALVAFGLALHLWPGFRNPVAVLDIRLSHNAAPFTQYLNFDKGAAGLFLLATYAPRTRNLLKLTSFAPKLLAITSATVIATIGTALAAGYVHVDFKLPSIALAFLSTNLFFTCVAEEAFFRGLIQERLSHSMSNIPQGNWIAVAASAISFGIAHAAGGFVLVVLATIAGTGYAIAYASMRRIEAAVLVHFALNTIQFLGFTYPHIAR